MQRLPIAFFQSRPVGTAAARMRELENVRQFITGSALSVGIDAVFTVDVPMMLRNERTQRSGRTINIAPRS